VNTRDRSLPVRRRQPVPPCIGTVTLRRKLWIELDGRFAIGEGGAELLREVDVQGSLAEGARRVGWSYRHAWGYVRRAESVLGVALVLTKPGKGPARGAVITPAAREIIKTLLCDSAESRPLESVNAMQRFEEPLPARARSARQANASPS
jgi:molybdate transport system regulatory protein